jgi:tRNA (pseudouridine54-N1)-methyltransferase
VRRERRSLQAALTALRDAAHGLRAMDPPGGDRFVVLGGKATGRFRLNDLPGTSGRLDALLRCLRAALLVSHGVRRSAWAYLVLGGDGVVLRVEGAGVRFLRPDERSLAVLAQKALAAPREARGFTEVRPGVSVADGGLAEVLADLGELPRFVLDERGEDVRGVTLPRGGAAYFLGDHLGMSETVQMSLGAREICVGPASVHAEDAVAVLCNELDRRRLSGR